YQPGIDQQPIEPTRLAPALTTVKDAAATRQNVLLLRERSIERDPGRLQDSQWKERSVQRIERRGKLGRSEVDRVDRIVRGVVARIVVSNSLCVPGLIERRVDEILREPGLVVAEAHHQKRLIRKLSPQLRDELRVVARTHLLTSKVFVEVGA